eukprot:6485787-Amphidinium_carterae.2
MSIEPLAMALHLSLMTCHNIGATATVTCVTNQASLQSTLVLCYLKGLRCDMKDVLEHTHTLLATTQHIH